MTNDFSFEGMNLIRKRIKHLFDNILIDQNVKLTTTTNSSTYFRKQRSLLKQFTVGVGNEFNATDLSSFNVSTFNECLYHEGEIYWSIF